MGFSTDNKNAVLDYLFGADTFSVDATIYVGLSTTEPTDAGANITEPVAHAYTRLEVDNDLTEWPAAVDGEKSNANDLEWAQATGYWGIIGWWVIFDAATDGNMLHFGKLQTARVVDENDQFRIMSGDLVISLRSGENVVFL
jgi:hypothetical protein